MCLNKIKIRKNGITFSNKEEYRKFGFGPDVIAYIGDITVYFVRTEAEARLHYDQSPNKIYFCKDTERFYIRNESGGLNLISSTNMKGD